MTPQLAIVLVAALLGAMIVAVVWIVRDVEFELDYSLRVSVGRKPEDEK